MGVICNKHGKNGIMILISMIIFIMACLIMLILPKYKYYSLPSFDHKFHPFILVPLIFIAIFYSIYSSAFWTCIPLTAGYKRIGIAFGVVDCVENLGIFIMTIIWGDIADKYSQQSNPNENNEYYYSIIFIMMMIFVALVISLILNYVDYNTDNILNKP